MGCPLFSCVMPVKGPRPYMEEALASLKAQGLGDALEVIVQDGDVGGRGMRDEDLGVRWISEEDCGQSDALNKGFAKARGEWLFWLNADDVLLPGALKKTKDYIGRVEHVDRVAWIAGNTVYIDDTGKVLYARRDAVWRSWFGLRMRAWTGGPSAFFRRALWEKRGGFDTALRYVMDVDLWTRWAIANERFAELDDYIWGFREHGGSATTGGKNTADHLRERTDLLIKHGIKHEAFWRNVTRMSSLLDGSWFARMYDSHLLRGKHWTEVVR